MDATNAERHAPNGKGKPRGVVASDLAEPVAALARDLGSIGAATALEVSPQTVGKLAGRLPVRPATATHVRVKLAAIKAAETSAA